LVTVNGNCTVCPGIAVSADRLSDSIRFGTCFTTIFNPPVEDAEDAEDVFDGGVSKVLVVLAGDGVTTGMLVAVLLFAGGRIGGVIVDREFVLAFACDPVIVGGLALRSRPVFEGFLLLFDDAILALAPGEVVFIT
jgi:hypothetical protein